MSEIFLAPSEVARLLGVSVSTIRMWELTGRLPAASRTVRGMRLYRRDDVERFQSEREAAALRSA